MSAFDCQGLTFAVLSSAADACHEVTQKALVSFMPHPELALAIKAGLIAIVFMASYVLQADDAWGGFADTFCSNDFLTAWVVAGAVNVGANFLMISGMKRGKISDTVPFLSLSPVFLLGSGYIFVGELIDIRGMLGVVTIGAGGFWLSRASTSMEKDAGAPCKSLPRQQARSCSLPPGAGIYIVIAMIQSVSSAFDKRGVRAAASPVLYGTTISTTVSLGALLKFAWQNYFKTCNQDAPDGSRVAISSNKQSQTNNYECLQQTFGAAITLCLVLLAFLLKMVAYWCQLKANERIYSAHLSAIRKCGVLLVLILGRVLFNEQVGHKWMPVSTMLLGISVLAAA